MWKVGLEKVRACVVWRVASWLARGGDGGKLFGG